jgi:hypothetical protein
MAFRVGFAGESQEEVHKTLRQYERSKGMPNAIIMCVGRAGCEEREDEAV